MRSIPSTMPAATPSAASCVVGTLTRATSAPRRRVDRHDVGERSPDIDAQAKLGRQCGEPREVVKSAPLTLRAPAGKADGSPISTPKRSLVTVLRYLTAQVPSFECVGLIPASGPSLTDASEGCGDCGNGFVPAGKQLDASRKPMTSAYCLGVSEPGFENGIFSNTVARTSASVQPSNFAVFKNSVPATAGPAVP